MGKQLGAPKANSNREYSCLQCMMLLHRFAQVVHGHASKTMQTCSIVQIIQAWEGAAHASLGSGSKGARSGRGHAGGKMAGGLDSRSI